MKFKHTIAVQEGTAHLLRNDQPMRCPFLGTSHLFTKSQIRGDTKQEIVSQLCNSSCPHFHISIPGDIDKPEVEITCGSDRRCISIDEIIEDKPENTNSPLIKL